MTDLIQGIIDRYQNFDRNADGDPAIVHMEYPDFEKTYGEIPQNARLVLVLVEDRILKPLKEKIDLQSRLIQYKGDLRSEGFYSRFISAQLYQGARHQDGRTLLAIRSFVREVALVHPEFQGVILVGSFPESTLIRRTIWRRGGDITLAGVFAKEHLAIQPELIASRSDIVLADLNGRWDQLYHEEKEDLESIRAIPDAATAATQWPVDGAIFKSAAFDRVNWTYRDFFFINDGDYAIIPNNLNQLHLFIRRQQLHPELAAADRGLANPICRPDILVSRINARNVAVNPKASITGDNGVRPLDTNGYPQAFTSNQNLDTWLGFYEQDPVLERILLCDFFDRNHRFRVGAFTDLPFRVGAIASPDFGTCEGHLAPASKQFQPPLVQAKATVLDYVRWFKKPAVLRIIDSHASPYSSLFGNTYTTGDLENEMGGKPFRWWHNGNSYTPSLHDQDIHADYYIHRTLWQYKALAQSGANLMIHGGCEVNAPQDTQSKTYYQDGYAGWQNAEGLLFYMNGLALIARAKVFNDLPNGFAGAFGLSSRARFGDGYRAYFDNEAAAGSLGTFNEAIRSKKAYFWSMIGDWTVRLRYWNGLGILGYDPDFSSQAIHADQAWIDGWNFSTAVNTIRGSGDFDGDGIAEFVITSDWGIGILKYDGQRWQQLVVAPNDTWFGGWRYNASVNIGKDRHQGIGRFTSKTLSQLLLMSSWGIGVLALAGTTLTSPVIQPNGTKFGGWVFDSRANQIAGIGDMDGNGLDEIVIISDWGIGILCAAGNTFTTKMLAANGTKFGGWVFDSRKNVIHALGDFDGDGRAEILVSSTWGLGILKLSGAGLTSIALLANGTKLSNFTVNTAKSQIVAVGDLAGDGRARILVTDGNGLHVLELKEGALSCTATWANGTNVAGWLMSTANNKFGPVGDFDGDGRAELVVRSPWGMGIIGLLGGNVFRCLSLHAYGSHIGDWIFEKNDRVAAADNFRGTNTKSELLIQKGY